MTRMTGRDGTPIIGIAGWKKSGKTTLTVRLVAEFVRRGFRVATVKHAHHDFQIDDAETDSARHRRAGSGQVAIVSRKRWAVVTERPDAREPDFADVIGWLDPCDLIVVEGYKSAPIPKIEARRRAIAVEIVEPPARLRSRILEAAAASARTPTQSPASARIIHLPRERVLRWSFGSLAAGFPKAAVAALALAVLGLGSWNVYLTTQLSREQAQVASGTLTGRGEMSGVQATVLDFKAHSLAVVSFSKMPAPPAGKVYELWLIPASGAAEGVAVFQPDIDGSKTVVVSRDLSHYKLMAVTVENGPSGALAPTQEPGIIGRAV